MMIFGSIALSAFVGLGVFWIVHRRRRLQQENVRNRDREVEKTTCSETVDAKPDPVESPAVKTQRIGNVNPWFESIYQGVLPDLPPISDLKDWEEESDSSESLEDNFGQMGRRLEAVLLDYKISATVAGYGIGPLVVRYQATLAPGSKVSRLVSLKRDLTRELAVPAVRVVEVLEGTPYIGVEIPRCDRKVVALKQLLSSEAFTHAKGPLNIVLGVDVIGHPVILDLLQLPHLLIAGTTGSGKSVGLNAILMSLLYKATPQEVRLILMDPKRLELSLYQGVAHLLGQVATNFDELMAQLTWCVEEMERRYQLLCALGVKNVADYNTRIQSQAWIMNPVFLHPDDQLPAPETVKPYPYLVVLIDEFSDLLMASGKEAELLLVRLAQKGRSAGIHLILATQRPSVDVITGVLKANIPARISFVVASKVDSRTILDQAGAENLLGKGDMLYLAADSMAAQRIHGAWVCDEEIARVVARLTVESSMKAETGPSPIQLTSPWQMTPSKFEKAPSTPLKKAHQRDDVLYPKILDWVLKTQQASISGIQREFRVGYNRAARLMALLEKDKVVAGAKAGNSRKVMKRSK